MTSPPYQICLVTVGSDEELQDLVMDFANRFTRDYSDQGIERGLDATVLHGWSNEDQVHVLIPAADGSTYVGALGFDLGMDRWSFIWAYLEPGARHLHLIEDAWPSLRELLYQYAYPMISHGAAVIVCDTPVSPAGASLVRRLGVPVTAHWNSGVDLRRGMPQDATGEA